VWSERSHGTKFSALVCKSCERKCCIKIESKETLFWFVILIPFYLTNTITQLFNKYNSMAYTPTIFSTSLQKTALSEQHYCYHVVWCIIQYFVYWWTQHFQFILNPVSFKHSILHETHLSGWSSHSSQSVTVTVTLWLTVSQSVRLGYRHLYIVLGRPHRKPLFSQPYPHNGLF
jgi:hypothetical protein